MTDFVCGKYEIDLAGREVRLHGINLELTRTEFDIFMILVISTGKVMSAKSISEKLGLSSYRSVQTHISHLRQKLGENCPVHNRSQFGYYILA